MIAARIRLWWHCLVHLFITLYTMKGRPIHREITWVHPVDCFVRYEYIGCTCGREFHGSKSKLPEEIAEVIREWEKRDQG